LKALFDSLGKEKATALLGMHAITSSDTTGKLVGRTKAFSFKVFLKASGAVLKSLSMLVQKDYDDHDHLSWRIHIGNIHTIQYRSVHVAYNCIHY
jgi:hypothetical protein